MILVFKTTVSKRKDIRRIKTNLDNQPYIQGWSFDLEDCDNVLRIDSKHNISGEIINLLNSNGFECVDLDPEITLLNG